MCSCFWQHWSYCPFYHYYSSPCRSSWFTCCNLLLFSPLLSRTMWSQGASIFFLDPLLITYFFLSPPLSPFHFPVCQSASVFTFTSSLKLLMFLLSLLGSEDILLACNSWELAYVILGVWEQLTNSMVLPTLTCFVLGFFVSLHTDTHTHNTKKTPKLQNKKTQTKAPIQLFLFLFLI